MTRKRDVRDKLRRLAGLRARRWEHYEELLSLLGLAGESRHWEGAVKERIWRLRPGPPEVVFDPAAPPCRDAQALGEEVGRLFTSVRLDGAAPVGDVFSLLVGLLYARPACRGVNPRPETAASLARVSRAVGARFEELLNRAEALLREKVVEVLIRYTRPCSHLFAFGVDLVPPADGSARRPSSRVTLTPVAPERVDVVVDGAVRRAWRCGAVVPSGRIHWVSWPAGVLGQAGGPAEYPVYLQEHALARLFERVPFIDAPHLVFDCAWRSLAEPAVSEPRGDRCLVEYRFMRRRVGYFVARRLADRVVLTTFLLLTMQGTPEARLLRERLRLARPDIEHLELDRLSTFVHGDIRDDPELVRIFRECGCGDLLNWGGEESRAFCRPGDAREVRAYLGLEPETGSADRPSGGEPAGRPTRAEGEMPPSKPPEASTRK